jgi:hypothetical protein
MPLPHTASPFDIRNSSDYRYAHLKSFTQGHVDSEDLNLEGRQALPLSELTDSPISVLPNGVAPLDVNVLIPLEASVLRLFAFPNGNYSPKGVPASTVGARVPGGGVQAPFR